MKPITKLRRAPRQKTGESDAAFQKRTLAYYEAKAVQDYEEGDLTDLSQKIEAEAALALEDETDPDKDFLTRYHTNERTIRRAAIVAEPTGRERLEPQEDTDPALLSRLDELLDRVGGLERLVDKLARLVAVTVPQRALRPAAKAAVIELAPELAEAFKDERVREVHETFEHVVNMGDGKKASANFPRALRDEVDYSGGGADVICRVIPLSTLLHRCAAKKPFRAVAGEESSMHNVRAALAKSGLLVFKMHEAGLKRGSQVKVVMDHAEAVRRGLVKGLPPVENPVSKPEVAEPPSQKRVVIEEDEVPQPKPKPQTRVVIIEEDDLTDTTDTVDEEPEPTTMPAVDDDEIDTEPWEEEDEQPEEGFAIYRTPEEEPKKSGKVVDLFGD